jgi:hypothetical protein
MCVLRWKQAEQPSLGQLQCIAVAVQVQPGSQPFALSPCVFGPVGPVTCTVKDAKQRTPWIMYAVLCTL